MPSKIFYIFPAAFLLIVLALYGCGNEFGNSDNLQKQRVSITPSAGTVDEGDTFTRTVEVHNIGKTFYAAFDLTHDPEVIEYVSATEGTFLSRNGTDSTSTQVSLQNNTQGRITVGITRLGQGVDEPSGSGTLLTLTFRAAGTGTTTLTFTTPRGFKDHANQDVAIDEWVDGTVTVQ